MFIIIIQNLELKEIYYIFEKYKELYENTLKKYQMKIYISINYIRL